MREAIVDGEVPEVAWQSLSANLMRPDPPRVTRDPIRALDDAGGAQGSDLPGVVM